MKKHQNLHLYLKNLKINKKKCEGVWLYDWSTGYLVGGYPIYNNIVYRSNDSLFFPIQHDSLKRVDFFENVVRKQIRFNSIKEKKLIKECIIKGRYPYKIEGIMR